MVLRETGAKLLMIIQMRMPMKDGRPRVNVKQNRPNACTVQLRCQIFSWPSARASPCRKSVFRRSNQNLIKPVAY